MLKIGTFSKRSGSFQLGSVYVWQSLQNITPSHHGFILHFFNTFVYIFSIWWEKTWFKNQSQFVHHNTQIQSASKNFLSIYYFFLSVWALKSEATQGLLCRNKIIQRWKKKNQFFEKCFEDIWFLEFFCPIRNEHLSW